MFRVTKLPVRMYQSGQRNMEFFQDEASWTQLASLLQLKKPELARGYMTPWHSD